MKSKPVAQPSNSEVEAFMRRFWQVVAGCVALFAVPMLIYAFYLNQRLDQFEDSLSPRAPQAAAAVSPDFGADLRSLDASSGQLVYVPAYSHIYHQNGRPHLLTVTLSVRNTSRRRPIVLNAVDYFDTKGEPIRSFLTEPVSVAPLETVEFVVARDDATGGSGANFLVDWRAEQPTSEPIIEAIMIDTSGQQGISFARSGRVVEERVPGDDAPAESDE